MKERDMQTLWGKHVQMYPPARAEVYELKFTKENRIPFTSLADHQQESLVKAEIGSFYHRITDQPWLPDRPWAYTLKKPFDCFVLFKAHAFVILWFYKPRQDKMFIKIPIRAWVTAQTQHGMKSLNEAEALQIGEGVVIEV